MRKDRNRHAGGVALMILDCLRWRTRLDLSDGGIESVWIELYPESRKRSMSICCTYRPRPPQVHTLMFYNRSVITPWILRVIDYSL